LNIPNILPVLTCFSACGLNRPSFTTGVFESLEYCEKLEESGFDVVSMSIGRLQGCRIRGAAIMDDVQTVALKEKVGSGRKRRRDAIVRKDWVGYAG
jgi:hypothetical protein